MSAPWPPRKTRKVGVISDDSVVGGLNVREFEKHVFGDWARKLRQSQPGDPPRKDDERKEPQE